MHSRAIIWLLLFVAAPALAEPPRREVQLAVDLFSRGHDRGAAVLFQKALRHAPPFRDKVTCHVYLGLIAVNARNDGPARSEFRQALALDRHAELPKKAGTRALELFLVAQRELGLRPEADVPPAAKPAVAVSLSPVALVPAEPPASEPAGPPQPVADRAAAAPPTPEAKPEARSESNPPPEPTPTQPTVQPQPIESKAVELSHPLRMASIVTGGVGAAGLMTSLGLIIAAALASSDARSAASISTAEQMSSRYAKLTYTGEWFFSCGIAAVVLGVTGWLVDGAITASPPVPNSSL